MGNCFGNYHDVAAAEQSLIDAGFERGTDNMFRKSGWTSGTLNEAPRKVTAICRVKRCRVAPQWNQPDYYQIEYL